MWKGSWSRVKFNSIVVFILINFLLTSFSTNFTTSHNDINKPEGNINTSNQKLNSRARSTIIDLNLETNEIHQNVTIYGQKDYDEIGRVMCSGDINDDGFDDLIFSSNYQYTNGPNNSRMGCGEVYVIFGKSVFSPIIDLSTPPDMIIYGAETYDALGVAMATGDVNNDGITDVILSAPNGDGIGNNRANCGEVYVIFGNKSLPSIWDLKKTPPQVMISGADSIDFLASSVTTGDFNGDNIDDIIMGTQHARGPTNQNTWAGEVYVIFGNSTLPSPIDLQTAAVFTIYGADPYDNLGGKIAAGDVNSDGYDDLIINSNYGKTVKGSNIGCGEVYVVYGNKTISLPASIDFKTTPANITIYGYDRWDRIGTSVASGDINGDSREDIIIGASAACGKNNARYLSGEVYVFFGNSSPAALIRTTDANLTIYGKSENDSMGNFLAVGRSNEDDIDDLLIGAQSADGPKLQEREYCGDTYVINGRTSFPGTIDLATSAPNMTIYGAENRNQAGASIVLSDLNGDNINEIAIGAVGGDGRGNENVNSGEIYIIMPRGEVLSMPIINSIDLINGGGSDGKTCYARNGIPYNFLITIIVDKDLSALHTVTISVGYDMPDKELKYSWSEATDKFTEIKDLNEYGMLSNKSYSKNDGSRIWTIKLFIFFNWTYKDNEYHSVQVYANYDSGEYDWLNLSSNIYRVENHLEFVGSTTVKCATQGYLSKNDWVRGSECLTWGGLKVVYRDNDQEYPSKDCGVTVNITDSSGCSWCGPARLNKEISIETTTANVTKINETYEIKITGIPSYCSGIIENFNLNIDADLVNFSNPFPDNNTFYATLNPHCGIRITDPTTSVNQESVQYRVSTDNGESWDNWTNNSINIVQDDLGINCTVRPSLQEGMENLIQWRAQDVVGNNYSASDTQQILTDVSNVTYQNPTPGPEELQREVYVTCGITIIDELSGVNASSIDFRVSTMGVWGYGDWQSARESKISNKINCFISPVFIEGTQNYINWRAKDQVGNGYQLSNNYQIKIKLNNPPETVLKSPEDEAILNTQTPELVWTGFDQDNNTQLMYNVYLSTKRQDIEILNDSAILTSKIKNTTYKVSTQLKDQTTYYWTVIPNDGIVNGTCKSDIWEFRIITTLEIPIVSLGSPENNSEIVETKPQLSWSLNYSNPKLVTYHLSISKSPDLMNNIVADSLKEYRLTTFIVESALIPGETYYWTVIPTVDLSIGKFKGECQSGIWNFKVILPSKDVYNISMKLDDNSLKVTQGNYTSNQVSIRNTGNVLDMISIHINKGILDANIALEDSNDLIRLEPNEQIVIQLGILVSENAKPQNYTVHITARSNEALNAKLDVSITESFNIQVIKKYEAQEITEAEPEEPTGKTNDMNSVIWLLAIIIVILFIIISLFVYRTKKAKKIPYVDSEILYQPPKYLGLPGAVIKSKKGELELPVVEKGVPVIESTTIAPQYQLPRAKLTKEQRLDLLEERFLLGEVSEETYKELKIKIESSKDEPVEEKEIEEQELEEAESKQEELEKEDIGLEIQDFEELESEEVQDAILETAEKETEEYELAAEDFEELSDVDLELKEPIETEPEPEPETETEIVPVVTEIEKSQKTKKKKIPKKKKKVKAKAKSPIAKEEIDVEEYEHELEESHHTIEELFWNDGTCVKCGEILELTSEYCWHCGAKYKVRKKNKKKK